MHREPGYYIPSVDEDVLDIRSAYILTNQTALHIKASKEFIDVYGTKRQPGDEWLILKEKVDNHILDAYEDLINVVDITVLASNQYCII